MSSSIWLTVEFSPGSDIATACKELCALANKLDVQVHASFNGVLLMACAGDEWTSLEAAWRIEINSKRPYRIATAQRGQK